MENFFLRNKHWLLFLLLSVPSLFTLGLMLAIFAMVVLDKPVFGSTYLSDWLLIVIGVYWLLSLVVVIVLSLLKKPIVRDFFLKSKHWQVFLIICIPLLFYHCGFFSVLALMAWNYSSVFHDVFDILVSLMVYLWIIVGITILPTTLIDYFYMQSLWGLFNDKLPTSLKRGSFLNGSYLVLFCVGCFLVCAIILFTGNHILPLFLLCGALFFPFLCFFLSSLSKMMKMVELQRSVQTKEALGCFFLLFFIPIGVWYLQPRVNRWVEGEPALATPSLTEDKREVTVE